MNIFDNVQTQAVMTAPKGIIYGPPGIGKTSLAEQAKDSIVINCENGIGRIKCQYTPYLSTWLEIQEWLVGLEKGEHKYGIAFFDTLDWMLRRIEEHVSGCTAGDKSLDKTLGKSHGGYGNGKQVLRNYLYASLIPQLNRIVDRGIAVIMLAHARRSEIKDIDGITIEKTNPDIADDYLSVFVEWSDFVCLARKSAEGQRILITEDTDRATAKNRYTMPPVIPFTWNDFVAAIGNGSKGKKVA